jgi:SOS response regulatory protein OraA/RecX
LSRRFDAELVERLLTEADENGWLAPEEQIAERLVLALQRRQKSGRYIEAQLMKRRLPKVKREEETEEEIIRGLVERKFGIEKLSFEEKAKAYRFLKYRGFADRMIRKVLNEKQ